MASFITAANQLAIASNSISISIDKLSEHIQLVGKTLKNMDVIAERISFLSARHREQEQEIQIKWKKGNKSPFSILKKER